MIMSTKEICKRGLSMTISLTLGNTFFPFVHGRGRYAQKVRDLFLRQGQRFALFPDDLVDFHERPSFVLLCFYDTSARAGGQGSGFQVWRGKNQPRVKRRGKGAPLHHAVPGSL